MQLGRLVNVLVAGLSLSNPAHLRPVRGTTYEVSKLESNQPDVLGANGDQYITSPNMDHVDSTLNPFIDENQGAAFPRPWWMDGPVLIPPTPEIRYQSQSAPAAVKKGVDFDLATERFVAAVKNGITPLISAAVVGDTEVVRYLLEEGVNVNQADNNGRTPLMLAAKKGHAETVALLLDQASIKVNQADNDGNTALIKAALKGHTEIIKLLLHLNSIDINRGNKDGLTPLLIASTRGDSEILKLLLAHDGSDVNQSFLLDNNNLTLLKYAITTGNIEIVKVLVSFGANIHEAPINGMSALDVAKKMGQKKVLNYLKGIIRDGDELLDRLESGIETKDLNHIKPLLDRDELANYVNKEGETPLTLACYQGNKDIVKILLKKDRININHGNKFSQTPLVLASFNGFKEIVRLLLSHNAIDVNKYSLMMANPLIIASLKGHTGIVKLLLAHNGTHGTDINWAASNGATALITASGKGHTDIVKLLLSYKGIDINKVSIDGETALSIAIQHGHTDIMGLLLDQKGIDIERQTQRSIYKTKVSQFVYASKNYLVAALGTFTTGYLVKAHLKKEAARKKLNKADKKYSKNLQNKTFSAWKKRTQEAKALAHRRFVEKEAERKRLEEEQRKSEERKAAYEKLDAAIQDLNKLWVNKIRLYRNGDVFYLCDGLKVAKTFHRKGKGLIKFRSPFDNFDYSNEIPIFQDGQNGRLYYCETEKVDLPSCQSLLTEKILCSTSKKIKKIKFNIEQLNLKQLKKMLSEQTTKAQKFENVAARLNEATQLTDRSMSNNDAVKSSELPQADQLSRSMPKLSGGNPIGRNTKIDRLKPLPSGGESKINDSSSEFILFADEKLENIKSEFESCKSNLAAAKKALHDHQKSLLPQLPKEYIAQVKEWVFYTLPHWATEDTLNTQIFIGHNVESFFKYDLSGLKLSESEIREIVLQDQASVDVDSDALTTLVMTKLESELEQLQKRQDKKLKNIDQQKSQKVLELEAQLKEIKEERKAHCNNMLGRIPNNINEIDDYLGRYGEYSSLELKTKDAKWKTGVHSFKPVKFMHPNGEAALYHYSRGKIEAAGSVTVFFHSNGDGTLNCIGRGCHSDDNNLSAKKGCTYTMTMLRDGTDPRFKKGIYYIPS